MVTRWTAALRRDARPHVRALLVAEVLVLTAFVAALTVPQLPVPGLVRDVVIGNLVYAFPIMLMISRGFTERSDRKWAWSLAAGLTCFLIGNLLYVLWVVNLSAAPFPSWADAGYLPTYPLFALAVVLSMRPRVGRLRGSVLLDGLTAGLAAATLGGLLVLPLAQQFDGELLQIVVAAAYPVADVVVVAMVLGVFAATGGHPGRLYGYLAVGMTVFAAADLIYAYRIAYGGYEVGTPLDALWAIAAFVLCLGVTLDRDPRPHVGTVGKSSLVITATCSVVAAGVLALSSGLELPLALVLLATATLLASAGRTIMAFKQVQDMTAIKRQAMTDDLTGLPNRRALYEDLDSALEKRAPGAIVGLAMLDLDRFKEVNDSLGHHAGDLLLEAVGTRLTTALTTLGSTGVVARLGGDEFALLMPDAVDVDAVMAVAHQLRQVLSEPVKLDGSVSVHARASTGVAVAPGDAVTRSDLLRCADNAMYRAKRSGAGVCLFQDQQSDDSWDRLRLAEDLYRALDNDELVVHYQPQVALRGSIGPGVEALVRWQHPREGLLPPDGFLALAEDHHLMPAITRIVLEIALADCARARRGGFELGVSVNLSAADLLDDTLPEHVRSSLARHAVPPSALTLEITETTVMSDPVRAQETLRRLHRYGVRLSVDDYGTGHCSLAYLRLLPVQELKLDRSFVTHMVSDPRDAAIMCSSVDLAHALGLQVVAEGVENAEALRMLVDAGCDVAQGWHFAPALPFGDLLDWFRRRHGDPPQDLVRSTSSIVVVEDPY